MSKRIFGRRAGRSSLVSALGDRGGRSEMRETLPREGSGLLVDAGHSLVRLGGPVEEPHSFAGETEILIVERLLLELDRFGEAGHRLVDAVEPGMMTAEGVVDESGTLAVFHRAGEASTRLLGAAELVQDDAEIDLDSRVRGLVPQRLPESRERVGEALLTIEYAAEAGEGAGVIRSSRKGASVKRNGPPVIPFELGYLAGKVKEIVAIGKGLHCPADRRVGFLHPAHADRDLYRLEVSLEGRCGKKAYPFESAGSAVFAMPGAKRRSAST